MIFTSEFGYTEEVTILPVVKISSIAEERSAIPVFVSVAEVLYIKDHLSTPGHPVLKILLIVQCIRSLFRSMIVYQLLLVLVHFLMLNQ